MRWERGGPGHHAGLETLPGASGWRWDPPAPRVPTRRALTLHVQHVLRLLAVSGGQRLVLRLADDDTAVVLAVHPKPHCARHAPDLAIFLAAAHSCQTGRGSCQARVPAPPTEGVPTPPPPPKPKHVICQAPPLIRRPRYESSKPRPSPNQAHRPRCLVPKLLPLSLPRPLLYQFIP